MNIAKTKRKLRTLNSAKS